MLKDEQERQWLERVAIGDESAFKMIFVRYQNRVYSYAIRIIQDEAAAEEVVQDIFLKIWLKRADLPGIINFGGYLKTITRNHTLNVWKKHLATLRLNAENTAEWKEEYEGPEEEINYKDALKVVHLALDTLPPQQKAVYYLCRIDGFKTDEVANQLNISKNTVKAHLQQASKTMKNYLADHPEITGMLLLIGLFK